MADSLFENLLKATEKRSVLNERICVVVSAEELDILSKKAEKVGMEPSDLLREYLVKTAAFEDVFSKKKAPSSKPKTSVVGG